jgi:hypothetical protein
MIEIETMTDTRTRWRNLPRMNAYAHVARGGGPASYGLYTLEEEGRREKYDVWQGDGQD